MATALSAASAGRLSAAGDAFIMFPPMVALFRIWRDPILLTASAKNGAACAITSDRSI